MLFFFSLSRSLNQPKKQADRRKVGSNDKEEEKGCRGKTEKTGSRVRETGVTSLTLASLPALRRLKHGKQQKKKKNAEEGPPPPDYTHTHTLTHAHTLQSYLDHVTAETSRLGCCPDKPGRNNLD